MKLRDILSSRVLPITVLALGSFFVVKTEYEHHQEATHPRLVKDNFGRTLLLTDISTLNRSSNFLLDGDNNGFIDCAGSLRYGFGHDVTMLDSASFPDSTYSMGDSIAKYKPVIDTLK